MRFSITVSGIETVFAGLEKKTIAKGTARGLTKMGQQARTAIRKRLRKVYTIRAAAVRKAISVSRANPTHLETKIRASGRPVSFRKYQARAGPKGVRVKVRRKKSPTLFPGSWLLNQSQVKTKATLAGLFKRPEQEVRPRREGHLPIEHIKGPSVPQLFGSRKQFKDIEKFVARKLDLLITHEIWFEVNKKRIKKGKV